MWLPLSLIWGWFVLLFVFAIWQHRREEQIRRRAWRFQPSSVGSHA